MFAGSMRRLLADSRVVVDFRRVDNRAAAGRRNFR